MHLHYSAMQNEMQPCPARNNELCIALLSVRRTLAKPISSNLRNREKHTTKTTTGSPRTGPLPLSDLYLALLVASPLIPTRMVGPRPPDRHCLSTDMYL